MVKVEDKTDIQLRLKKIEGQIRGLQKMIHEGRSCEEIFSQMSAIDGALKRVALIMAQRYINECTNDGVFSKEKFQESILKVLKTVSRS
ncbi:MAG: metal-sensitive transcriptional regulator [Thermodesulfovibrionales bacterium]|nr:metal-sensitive transcriptional regulator [Thermodesulfovibrionales bacterium]